VGTTITALVRDPNIIEIKDLAEHEGVTGHRPFGGNSITEVLFRVLTEEPDLGRMVAIPRPAPCTRTLDLPSTPWGNTRSGHRVRDIAALELIPRTEPHPWGAAAR
jgi:hypothetical protein